MSRQIILQPNGKFSVFSSIVDNFIYTDMTSADIISAYCEEECNKIENDVTDITNRLINGEKPYYQFTLSFEEATKLINKIHK